MQIQPPCGFSVSLELDGAGSVILVGGCPGDPGLLTVAGLEAIKNADVIVCDRLASLSALQHARREALIIEVAKIPRGSFTPQERINQILIEHAAAGKTVARLKGGDPSSSDAAVRRGRPARPRDSGHRDPRSLLGNRGSGTCWSAADPPGAHPRLHRDLRSCATRRSGLNPQIG
jgi:Tetrapyrrole (Corrin/Porphyrin) Methylases